MSIRKSYYFQLLLFVAFFFLTDSNLLMAQNPFRNAIRNSTQVVDSTISDTIIKDSTIVVRDSVAVDPTLLRVSKDAVKEVVSYKAADSVAIELDTKKA